MSDNKIENPNEEFVINLETKEENSVNNTSLSVRIPKHWKDKIDKLSKKNDIKLTNLIRASIIYTYHNFDNVKEFIANKRIENVKSKLANFDLSNDDITTIKRLNHQGLIINFTQYKVTLNENTIDLIFYNQNIEVCKYTYPIFEIKVH